MDVDLSSDSWRFQNGHGLHNQRTSDANFIADLFYAFSVGDSFEDVVMFMQGMPDFVDGVSLVGLQFSVFPGLLLEEEADFASRVQEVFAEAM